MGIQISREVDKVGFFVTGYGKPVYVVEAIVTDSPDTDRYTVREIYHKETGELLMSQDAVKIFGLDGIDDLMSFTIDIVPNEVVTTTLVKATPRGSFDFLKDYTLK